jgi:hypothetical protein
VVPKAVKNTDALAKAMIGVGTQTKAAGEAAKEHAKTVAEEAKRIAKNYADLVDAFEKYNLANIQAQNNVARLGLDVDQFGKKVDVNHETMLAYLGLMRDGFAPVLTGLANNVTNFGDKVDLIPPKVVAVKDTLGALSKALAELATVSGGTVGAIASGFATVVGVINTAKKAFDTLREGAKEGFSLDGILSMTSGITGLISAAMTGINILKKLFSLGGPSEEQRAGRALIAEFHNELEAMLTAAQRAEAGNEAWKMDVIAIRDAYIAAGKTVAEAEAATKKLWESAEGGSETARKAIEEIRRVIGKNTDATEEATAATEEQAKATIETATEASLALKTLNNEIHENEGVWTAWADVVMRALRAVADGVGAIRVPSPGGAAPVTPMAAGGYGRVTRPTLFMAGEAGPEDFAFSGAHKSFGGGGSVVINVDGSNSFYQNLGDMQRLAQVVGKAVRVELGLTARMNTA